MKLTAGGTLVVTAILAILLISHGGLGHGWWIAANILFLPLLLGFFYFLLRDMFGD